MWVTDLRGSVEKPSLTFCISTLSGEGSHRSMSSSSESEVQSLNLIRRVMDGPNENRVTGSEVMVVGVTSEKSTTDHRIGTSRSRNFFFSRDPNDEKFERVET